MINKFLKKWRTLSENDRIVYKNVFGAFLVKGGALIVTLLTLPAYIRFFNNNEVLGLWYTILSLLNWILNFDLGIGNGLRNHLTTSLSVNDKEATRKYISSAYFSVGGIVTAASVAFAVLIKYVNLNSVMNITEAEVSPEQLRTAVIIVFIGVMAQFWLKLINSVLYALQKSSVNNFLVLCTNTMVLLVAMIYPSGNNAENVIVMAIVHALAVALPLIVASVIVFLGRLRYAIPRWRWVSAGHTKRVLSLGGVFFLVQIAYMVIMSTNEFLITRMAGNSYVVDYQAYYKLFSLGSTLFALAMTPIWSAITKAKAENNLLWIGGAYKKLLLLCLVFSVVEVLLIPMSGPIMTVWLGADAIPEINYTTCFLFSILGCLMMLNSVMSSIANGLGELKVQAIAFFVGAVLKIPLSYLFIYITGSWTGVLLANIVCMAMYCVAQPLFIKKYLSFKEEK